MAKHAKDYYEKTNKKGKKEIVMSYTVFKAMKHVHILKALNISGGR